MRQKASKGVRTRARSKVISQMRQAIDAWAKHHPCDTVFGAVVTNEPPDNVQPGQQRESRLRVAAVNVGGVAWLSSAVPHRAVSHGGLCDSACYFSQPQSPPPAVDLSLPHGMWGRITSHTLTPHYERHLLDMSCCGRITGASVAVTQLAKASSLHCISVGFSMSKSLALSRKLTVSTMGRQSSCVSRFYAEGATT